MPLRLPQVAPLVALAANLCLVTIAHAQTSPTLFARDLGTIGGQRGEAVAISATGLIAGLDVAATTGRRPVRLTVVPPGGKITDLDEWARPRRVDDTGVVVGTAFSATRSHAFRWTEATGLVALPFTPGGRKDDGVGIDARGRIAVSGRGAERQGVFIWNPADETYTELAALRGLAMMANGMSARGAVAGLAREVTEAGPDAPSVVRDHPVLWDEAGKLHELPVLQEPDGTRWEGEAVDVNDAGTVVGTLSLGERVHAVAWLGPDHVLRDLGPGTVSAINAHDVAAGGAAHPESTRVPYARYLPRLWDLRRQTTIPLAGFAAAPTAITDGRALDIDDRGVAVGWISPTEAHETYAVVFDRYEPAAAP